MRQKLCMRGLMKDLLSRPWTLERSKRNIVGVGITSFDKSEILKKVSTVVENSIQGAPKVAAKGDLQRGHLFSSTSQKSESDSTKKQLGTSVQELASRAPSRAMAEAAKNITTPKSAYQFEVSWRGLSGDPALQACLLKVCQ